LHMRDSMLDDRSCLLVFCYSAAANSPRATLSVHWQQVSATLNSRNLQHRMCRMSAKIQGSWQVMLQTWHSANHKHLEGGRRDNVTCCAANALLGSAMSTRVHKAARLATC
jgi:hypothetical protein